MSLAHILQQLHERFEFHEWKHAVAILRQDFAAEWQDILDLLKEFRLCRSFIVTPGGSKSPVALAIDRFLLRRGWAERSFRTAITVDDQRIESPTHKVDCLKIELRLK